MGLAARLRFSDVSVRSEPRRPSEEPPLVIPRARRSATRLAVLSVSSAALAGAVALGIRQLTPDGLQLRTDIVGYPTFANFDINRYFYNYYLIGLLFPAMSALFFFILGKAVRLAPPHPESKACQRNDQPSDGTGRLRSAMIGGVLGIELAVALNVSGWAVAMLSGAVAVGATGLVLVLAGGLTSASAASRRYRTAALNALLAPSVIGGLLFVSSATAVDVVATGSTDQRDWLPQWLGLGVTGGLIAWVAFRLLSAGGRGSVLRLERHLARGVVGSVLLYLITASIPGPVGVDMFHDGEALVPTILLREGLFPWRDFVFIHGLFNDLIRSAVGIRVFEDTAWGSVAGQNLVLVPLNWLALYALACQLFPRNRAALWLAGLLAVTAAFPYAYPRFLLWPVVLVALARLLDRPSWGRAATFVLLLAVQTIVTPESAYAVIACGATVLAFDVLNRQRIGLGPAALPRIWRCVPVGLAAASAFLVFLAANGAVGAFISGTVGFARGHRFTGGVPITWGGWAFAVAAVVPVAAVAVSIWYFAALLSRRRALHPHDGVLLAAALLMAMYYPKFLARADGHVFQVFSVSFPLLIALAARSCDALDGSRIVLRRWGPRPLSDAATAVVLLVVLVFQFTPLRQRLSNIATAFHPSAPLVDELKVGYTTPEALDRARIEDLGLILDRYIGPSDTVFDFTNEPALFHYLLEARPASRFFHISMAIRQEHQREVIDDLKRRPPRIVILDVDVLGLPTWDGVPNVVRHYEVSQYLLDTFKPLMFLHGYVLMAQPLDVERFLANIPPGLHVPPQFHAIGYGIQACDWGYVPNFLASRPSGSRVSLTVSAVSGDRLRIQIPLGLNLRDFRWFELVSDRGFEDGEFALWAGEEMIARNRAIHFRSRSTGKKSLAVRVGSCPAWHVFDGTASLVLQVPATQPITAVRLIR